MANPKNLQKLHKKLRLAQKSLSRKTKRSNNYQKARLTAVFMSTDMKTVVIKIDRYFPSSKRCSNCGYLDFEIFYTENDSKLSSSMGNT